MSGQRRLVAAVGLGLVLFAAACAVPAIGAYRNGLDTGLFQLYGERIVSGRVPYRDFSLEYPPGSIVSFALPALGPSSRYGQLFELESAVFGAICVAAVAAALVALSVRGRRLYSLVALAALAPLALGPVALARFDFLPAAVTAVALLLFLRSRSRAAFASVAVATAVKLYPFVLLPIWLFSTARLSGSRAVRTALLWFLGTVVAIVGPFVVAGPGGVAFAVERQAGRGLQIESLGSSLLLALHNLTGLHLRASFGGGSWNLVGTLPALVAALQTLIEALALVLVYRAFARGRREPVDLALASSTAVLVFVVFGRVLSPQFLVWLVPLVPLALARRGRLAGVLLLVAMLLTRWLFNPGHYDRLVGFEGTPTWILLCRNVALVALLVVLAAQIGRTSRSKKAVSASASA